MALLAINLSDKVFLDIKELVEKGKYQSPESFIEIAAFNQLALERGATPAEIVERGHRRIRETSIDTANGGVQRSTELDGFCETETKTAVQKRTGKAVARTGPSAETVADQDVELAFKRLAKTVRGEGSSLPGKAAPDHDPNDHV